MARVLIIDDVADICLLSARALERVGYEVATALDGELGLALFRDTSFDLVITDMQMPCLGGREVIRTLRQLKPGIRIIAISGGAFMTSHGHATKEEVGADCLLDKPYRIAQLQAVVTEVLAQPH